MSKETEGKQNWVTVGSYSYLGKNKDLQMALWDQEYGKGKWRLAWELVSGEVLNFDQIFDYYVESYAKFFEDHLEDALFLTNNFSYAYDHDMITKEEAFDPYALYDRPGRPNQFHHVALNFALEYVHGLEFKGTLPIKVREGKSGTDPATWPAGWLWSPGRIPASHPELIPPRIGVFWWQPGSIEDLYQSAKVLQVTK